MITINETNLKNNQKLKIDGYSTYNRNRQNEHMGGVATAIQNKEAHDALKVTEGIEKDEYIVTRHGQFEVPINIINVYGEIESRQTHQNIQDRWDRILAELAKVEMKGEFGLLMGDLNKHVGNLVEGNTDYVSFGGQLVRNLIETGKYILVNGTDKARGGPFTRYDPARPGKKSCIDLVILSKELLKYVHRLEIDKHLVCTPGRPINKKKTTFSDHFSLNLIFKNLPLKSNLAIGGNKHTMWNTNKVGGWEVYKLLTDNNENLKSIPENDVDTSVVMKKIQDELEKAKYKAFGKVTVKSRKKPTNVIANLNKEKLTVIEDNPDDKEELIERLDEQISTQLLSTQRENFEKEIKALRDSKSKKGKSATIFALKNKIVGKKKGVQEAVVVKDPNTKVEIYEPEEIKKVSLAYCVKLLTNRDPKVKFKEGIELKVQIHEERMKEILDRDLELSKDMFESSLKAVKSKHKKYEFLIKGGNSLKEALYKLYEKVWISENLPSIWDDTTIIQIYKGKGVKEDLNNQRNIHTKLDVPKLFGHMVTTAAKGKIVENMTKFQLGTKPGHRAQEHLFVAHSTIQLYNLCGKAVIVQLYDIQKFFDREMLRDCMDALYNSGIRGKLYRLLYQMNKQTNVRVRTGVGLSDNQVTGEGVGQGTLEGALLSASSIDYTVDNFFRNSIYEISYGSIKLQPLLYQDDVFRLCLDPFSAQIGNEFMDNIMETKLLDFNLDKSCYMVVGNKSAKAEIKDHFKVQPLTLSGKPMKEVEHEKYLGDYISASGTAESSFITTSKRHKKSLNALYEIKAVIEDCRAEVVGGIVTGLEIWELAVIPYLINNCETWACMPQKTLDILDSLQNQFLRSLLATPRGTPTPALMWETGTSTMGNRILKRKLIFVHHLFNLPETSLANQCARMQEEMALPGLISGKS